MSQICIALANYCEKGVQPSRIQSLSYPAIGTVTVMLIDWILLARVVAVSKYSFLSNAQWKFIQELGSETEGKSSEYLNWIKSRFPYCPNASACGLTRTQIVGYINFILKNHHCNWTGFHTYIQQLEDEHLNDGKITAWCESNGFDLSTDC